MTSRKREAEEESLSSRDTKTNKPSATDGASLEAYISHHLPKFIDTTSAGTRKHYVATPRYNFVPQPFLEASQARLSTPSPADPNNVRRVDRSPPQPDKRPSPPRPGSNLTRTNGAVHVSALDADQRVDERISRFNRALSRPRTTRTHAIPARTDTAYRTADSSMLQYHRWLVDSENEKNVAVARQQELERRNEELEKRAEEQQIPIQSNTTAGSGQAGEKSSATSYLDDEGLHPLQRQILDSHPVHSHVNSIPSQLLRGSTAWMNKYNDAMKEVSSLKTIIGEGPTTTIQNLLARNEMLENEKEAERKEKEQWKEEANRINAFVKNEVARSQPSNIEMMEAEMKSLKEENAILKEENASLRGLQGV